MGSITMIRVATVIPRLRLPRHRSAFDYQIPEGVEVKPGNLVRVHLRSRHCWGIVTNVRSVQTPSRRLKTCEIMDPPMFVSEVFLLILKELCQDFAMSPSLALLTMLPEFPLRSFAFNPIVKAFSSDIIGEIPPTGLPLSRLRALTKMRPSLLGNRPIFLLYQSHIEKMVACAMAIKPLLQEQKQILLLTPTEHDVEAWKTFLKRALPSAAIFNLPSQRSKHQALSLWQTACSGKPLILLGTRRSVFIPLPRLGRIIIDDADNPEHVQWDQNPRYDPRKIAWKCSDIAKVPMLETGLAPSVSVLVRLEQRNGLLIDLRLPFPETQLNIINLEEMRRKGEKGLLSERLLQAMTLTMESSKTVFLYFPRKGIARTIFCRDCSRFLRCLTCNRTLFPRSDHEGECKTCRTILEFNKCPSCGSPRLFLKGWGLTSLRIEIQRHFPHAVIQIIEKQESNPKTNGQPNIILGTSYAFSRFHWEDCGLIAYLLPDMEWNLPEFDASQQVFRTLLRLQGAIVNTKNAHLYIQTFFPDHPSLKAIETGKLNAFLEQERVQREERGYPPFRRVFRLIFSADHDTMAANKAETLSHAFRKIPRATIDFLGPVPHSTNRFRLLVALPLDVPVDLTNLVPPDVHIEPLTE